MRLYDGASRDHRIKLCLRRPERSRNFREISFPLSRVVLFDFYDRLTPNACLGCQLLLRPTALLAKFSNNIADMPMQSLLHCAGWWATNAPV